MRHPAAIGTLRPQRSAMKGLYDEASCQRTIINTGHLGTHVMKKLAMEPMLNMLVLYKFHVRVGFSQGVS